MSARHPSLALFTSPNTCSAAKNPRSSNPRSSAKLQNMATILQRVQDAHPCNDELAALVQEQLAIGVVLEPGTLVECSCGKQYVKVDPATNDGVEWKKKRAPRKTKAQKAAEAAALQPTPADILVS